MPVSSRAFRTASLISFTAFAAGLAGCAGNSGSGSGFASGSKSSGPTIPRAVATFELLSDVPAPGTDIETDYATRVAKMSSDSLVNRVARRLDADDKIALLKPYLQNSPEMKPTVEKCLRMGRWINAVRGTRLVTVNFSHPDGALATKVANYFVEEINRNEVEEAAKLEDPVIERMNSELQQLKQDIADLRKKAATLNNGAQEPVNDEIRYRQDALNKLRLDYDSRRAKASISGAKIRVVDTARVREDGEF